MLLSKIELKPEKILIITSDVGWKDKWHTPRYEEPPYIWIHLFKYNWIWYWELPNEKYMDDYWEQALWYLYYYDNISYKCSKPNINKAKEMIEYTGCDGIMIGRGVLGNPWLMKEVITYLNDGIVIEKPSYEERIGMCFHHLDYLRVE